MSQQTRTQQAIRRLVTELKDNDILWAHEYLEKKCPYMPPNIQNHYKNSEELENWLISLASNDHTKLILNRFKAAHRERKNRKDPKSRQLSITLSGNDNSVIERLCRGTNYSKKELVLNLIRNHHKLYEELKLQFEQKYENKIHQLKKEINFLKERGSPTKSSNRINELSEAIDSLRKNIENIESRLNETVVPVQNLPYNQRINNQSEATVNDKTKLTETLNHKNEACNIERNAPKNTHTELEELISGFDEMKARIKNLEEFNKLPEDILEIRKYIQKNDKSSS